MNKLKIANEYIIRKRNNAELSFDDLPEINDLNEANDIDDIHEMCDARLESAKNNPDFNDEYFGPDETDFNDELGFEETEEEDGEFEEEDYNL
jgi:hypothetical protein